MPIFSGFVLGTQNTRHGHTNMIRIGFLRYVLKLFFMEQYVWMGNGHSSCLDKILFEQMKMKGIDIVIWWLRYIENK